MAMMGGIGYVGYKYMKNNPEITHNMKQMIKSAAKRTYEMMNDVD